MDELPALSNAVLLPSSSSGEAGGRQSSFPEFLLHGRVPLYPSLGRPCCSFRLLCCHSGKDDGGYIIAECLGKEERLCTARGLEKSSTCQFVQQVNAWEDST